MVLKCVCVCDGWVDGWMVDVDVDVYVDVVSLHTLD